MSRLLRDCAALLAAPLARITVFAGLLAVLATACGSGVLGSSSGMTIAAKFENTSNLFEGSVVRVAGVDVGQVTQIDAREGDTAVTVEMTLPGDMDVPADVRAVIVPEALLGERYVQLDPPYTGGPKLQDGATLGLDRTGVPTNFDQVLDSLNEFLDKLPEQEVARLVDNIATVLDGRGGKLGRTLEDIDGLIDGLRQSDQDLVRLASTLSDFNETIASRDEQVGQLIEDFNRLAATLAANRQKIESALDALVRLTEETGDLLVDHRSQLEEDIATLTRIGRTAVRNIERFENSLRYQKELFRGAGRVVDREHNWLPLVEQFDQLAPLIADRVADRVVGLCLRLGVDECSAIEDVEDQIPDQVCFDPVLPCQNAAEGAVPLSQALDRLLETSPELRERLREEDRDIQDLADDVSTPPSDTDGTSTDRRSPSGDRTPSPTTPSPSPTPDGADSSPLGDLVPSPDLGGGPS